MTPLEDCGRVAQKPEPLTCLHNGVEELELKLLHIA
jgi:hypothetical protein